VIKVNKHIQIVRSAHSWLTSMSQESSDAILSVLSKHYVKVGVSIVNDLADLETLVTIKPDIVVLGMKFVPMNNALGQNDPNKIWVSEYLDEHGISYTGSSQMAHELEKNKPLAKQTVLDAGLKTSPFYVVKQGQGSELNDMHLKFPVFIKPANRGGGLGIDSGSLAQNLKQLRQKVQSIATNLQSDSLIEEYLPGREFSVAILKNLQSLELFVMPIELIAPPDKYGICVLTGEVKSANSECAIVVNDEPVKSKVITLATNAFNALGARDYGRIDIRLDAKGIPHFLEANLIPSLISGYGSFPKACLINNGLEYESMILNIVELAFARDYNVSNLAPDIITETAYTLPAFEAALEPLT